MVRSQIGHSLDNVEKLVADEWRGRMAQSI